MTKNKMSIQTFFICPCWIGYVHLKNNQEFPLMELHSADPSLPASFLPLKFLLFFKN